MNVIPPCTHIEVWPSLHTRTLHLCRSFIVRSSLHPSVSQFSICLSFFLFVRLVRSRSSLCSTYVIVSYPTSSIHATLTRNFPPPWTVSVLLSNSPSLSLPSLNHHPFTHPLSLAHIQSVYNIGINTYMHTQRFHYRSPFFFVRYYWLYSIVPCLIC